MLRAFLACPEPGQYPPARVLEGRAGTGDTGHGCTRRAWGLGTRMEHAHLVREAAPEPLLGPPLQLKLSQRQQPQRCQSLQQRPWGKSLNCAPCGQRNLVEEQPRELKGQLELLGEQAKETGERSELQAEWLLAEEEIVPHSALGTRKRPATKKSLSIYFHQMNKSFQNPA